MLLVHRDALDEVLPPFPQIVRQVIGALVPGKRYEEVQRDRHGLRISDLADVSPSACLPSWSLSPCALMSATTYYSVHGTTTSKIFEDIKAHGLSDQDGKHAEGLTSAKSEIRSP